MWPQYLAVFPRGKLLVEFVGFSGGSPVYRTLLKEVRSWLRFVVLSGEKSNQHVHDVHVIIQRAYLNKSFINTFTSSSSKLITAEVISLLL